MHNVLGTVKLAVKINVKNLHVSKIIKVGWQWSKLLQYM